MKITNVTLTAMALLTPYLFAEQPATTEHDQDDHSEKAHDNARKNAGPMKAVFSPAQNHTRNFS